MAANAQGPEFNSQNINLVLARTLVRDRDVVDVVANVHPLCLALCACGPDGSEQSASAMSKRASTMLKPML